MAGDWIKIEKSTARKPEVLAISSALGIHPDHAFGLCVRFWSWCDDQLENGHADSVTNVTLDFVIGHSGFAQQLIRVGWLAETESGIDIPNFDYHLSESAKTRAQAAKRKSKSRAERDKCHGKVVTKTRPEKRREEITTEGRKSEHLIPKKLDDAECHAAAEKWFAYLASKGLEDKSPEGNEIALEEWWRQMAKLSRADFLEAVSESISAGRWNVKLTQARGDSKSKTNGRYPDDLLKICTVCKQHPQDPAKRREILGAKLHEISRRLDVQTILSAIGDDWKMKSLNQFYGQHVKDLECKTT